jgi:hypothetical protein
MHSLAVNFALDANRHLEEVTHPIAYMYMDMNMYISMYTSLCTCSKAFDLDFMLHFTPLHKGSREFASGLTSSSVACVLCCHLSQPRVICCLPNTPSLVHFSQPSTMLN